jgi:hypothetical protein
MHTRGLPAVIIEVSDESRLRRSASPRRRPCRRHLIGGNWRPSGSGHTFVTPVVEEKPPVPQSQRELVAASLLVRPRLIKMGG